ncbi:hypothetical protein FSP39_000761 [Pinctada imbricata]|uniref:RING-type domain-containing protein n=1 Tax=Pinctada imbricata TaxID=66713 RepID=A0AA89BN73_PINIB|nr:hypothetical protein FSP39_000761 [Pinctada imbricata]
MEHDQNNFSPINGGQNTSGGQNPSQTDDDANTCVVCMDNPINTVFLPCRHSKCCRECASSLQLCPLCRARINETMDIFR